MNVSGTIEHQELPTALSLLGRGRGTGVLAVAGHGTRARIALADGEVLFANSDRGPKLGEVLVSQGVVDRDEMEAIVFVQRQATAWQRLGVVLLEVGVVSRQQVEAGIEAQVTCVLGEIFAWTQGIFRFEPATEDWGALVLPGCRQLDQYQLRVAMDQADAGTGWSEGGD